jgi:hypothetical protein
MVKTTQLQGSCVVPFRTYGIDMAAELCCSQLHSGCLFARGQSCVGLFCVVGPSIASLPAEEAGQALAALARKHFGCVVLARVLHEWPA